MPKITRVAIVTGASGGIGRAVSEHLAGDGLQVVVGYSGVRSRAEETVAAIGAAGGSACAFAADVADEAQAAALFSFAQKQYGGVDVVVNATGLMILKPLVDIDFTDFDRLFRVNVRGTFVVSQLAAKHVRRGGALVNFSSTIPKLGTPSYSAYAATKGAVDAATLIFARELRGKDITVNTVAPGPTATPLFFEGKTPQLIDTIARQIRSSASGRRTTSLGSSRFSPDPRAGSTAKCCMRTAEWHECRRSRHRFLHRQRQPHRQSNGARTIRSSPVSATQNGCTPSTPTAAFAKAHD